MKFFKRLIFLLLSIGIIGGGYYAYAHRAELFKHESKSTAEKGDVYVRLALEAFDKIKNNYWAKPDEVALSSHFQLSVQKALNSPTLPPLATNDRAGVEKMLIEALASASTTEAKKNFTINTLVVALYNLPPVGHGQLLSAKQETELRQSVGNVNPEKDLYKDLGLASGASQAEVEKAYTAKVTELKNATTTEAKAQLAQAEYAKKVLANPNTKDLYDSGKIEPTLGSKVIGKTLYMSMDKISPTSFIEFGRTILSATTTPGLDSLIIDFRGNLGGALDFAAAFVGLFIGPNQYAYDLFHQGDYVPQRTTSPKFPELARYKEIAILTDGITQSTAEVTTAAMKRLNLAHSVGETTRGWGTVENTFPLETSIDPSEKYSLLLVHSLTLSNDNQPIEGSGVLPDVNTKNKNWQKELPTYFKNAGLIKAIEQAMAKPPVK